ncbi:hypothetical protein KEM55_007680, partial [Ascosphaera atra]
RSPMFLPLDHKWDYLYHGEQDAYNGFPSTPTLSMTSGSAMSSPPASASILHTPVHGDAFFSSGVTEPMEGVKEGCQNEVLTEVLSSGFDWQRSRSPPLSPVFLNKPMQNTSCPSPSSPLLSSSSSPTSVPHQQNESQP